MKKLHCVCMLTGLVLLAACNNAKQKTNKPDATEKKSEQGTVAPTGSGDNIISFSVNGEQVNSSGWNISRFNFGSGAGTSINVTSNMHEEPKTINININSDKPGTYSLQSGMSTIKTPGVAYGSYKPDYMGDMGNTYSFKDGEFVIISIDTAAGVLNATFHGTAKNMKGESVTISDGKVINGKLKTGLTKMN
jgi:hypothetical protein